MTSDTEASCDSPYKENIVDDIGTEKDFSGCSNANKRYIMAAIVTSAALG